MASKADTWMPLYIADYLRKTMHLTRDQHGAYLLLLMACWDRGGRLPNDPRQLAGIARATAAEWKKLAPVLMEFFTVDGEFLTQGRVMEEREKAQKLSDARRDAGQKGGRPKKQTGADCESSEKPIGFSEGGFAKANSKQTETPTRVASPSPIPPPTEVSVPNGTGAQAPSGQMDPLADLRGLEPKAGAWRLALKLLMSRGGYPEARARPLVGKWAKATDPNTLWRACEAAWNANTLDPVSYITAALERMAEEDGNPLLRPSEARQRLWMADFRTNPAQWREHERGPRPGQPGCRISEAIQREFSTSNETEGAAA